MVCLNSRQKFVKAHFHELILYSHTVSQESPRQAVLIINRSLEESLCENVATVKALSQTSAESQDCEIM